MKLSCATLLAAVIMALGLVACRGTRAPVSADSTPATSLVDSDHDGVSDTRDHCPGTARRPAIEVDALGCPRDTDNDGFADYRDKCPGTSHGAGVDEIGCELDADSDGVFDSKDRCPGTSRGDKVDMSGCAPSSNRS